MDPVSVGLLAALAGGAGGEIGRQAWVGLSTLVRHPLRGGQDADDDSAVSSGEAELTELERVPADPVRAQVLSTALALRAARDADFRLGLERWHEQAGLLRSGESKVDNTISGGIFHGPTLQGRDISRISFTTAPASPPPSSPDHEIPSAQG
ncbi:hypothetical protein GTY54_25085 [Streptomyces sp. SID625]|nr:hypothetical protein [Streptomyces sp. SID625]